MRVDEAVGEEEEENEVRDSEVKAAVLEVEVGVVVLQEDEDEECVGEEEGAREADDDSKDGDSDLMPDT